ncbi:hypothetical protein [Streptomyces sp. TS71-3]|uniref:hypothetical protein n=1 Tax=Streptomyces sp. TS71-3 TaxID=2733862 RepID=UPI001B1E618A|nr:hypothetical protein [Streptomyces sp. TS71-3]GHJ38345.1 hypothetical protein Sm713_39540 [Streptomyces sp. TS71-3]
MRNGTHTADAAAAELAAALGSGPFHVALRAAISVRGLSLQRVQHHLARRGVNVGVTSLSYWQQGARRPQRDESMKAVRALEEILRLPEESLIRLLSQPPPEDGGAPRSPARSYRDRLAASGTVERLLSELGSPAGGGLHTLGHHERVHIGARRELCCCDSQLVVRATEHGRDRYVAVHHGDPGCDPERMAVRAMENCRTGRVLWSREAGVLVAELLFDTHLRHGDTHVFRYAFEDGTAGPSHEYSRGFGATSGQYVLQVRFAEGALPVRCRRFARHSAAAALSDHQDLALSSAHRCAHLVEPQARSGLLGIGWDWE